MTKDFENKVDKNKQEELKKKLPALTTAEVELQAKIQRSIEQHRKYVFPDAYKIIKNKLLFDWDMKMFNSKAGRKNDTASIFPLTESIHDTFNANLYDSVVLPRVAARRKEDVELSQDAQDFCDWAYDISDAVASKKLLRGEASLIGTSYWMASWHKDNLKHKYTTNWNDEEVIDLKTSRPSLEHVSFFELFLDISESNFYRARRKARRKILSLQEIKRRYWTLIDFTDEKESRIKSTVWGELCSYDFTKIYDIKNYSACYNDGNLAAWSAGETQFIEDNVLIAIDWNNPFMEVIEYWYSDDEWGKLVIMINGYIYYDGLSPYPYWDPFWIVVYEPLPWTYRWRGIGNKIMTLQQQATSLHCAIRDATNQHIRPMYAVVKWMLAKWADWKTTQTIEYSPWKVVQVEDPSVKNWWLTPLSFVDYNMVSIAQAELNNCIARAQEIAWVNSYTQWGQGKVERSWIAAQLKVWVMKTRLKPIESSLQSFDQHCFDMWLLLWATIGWKVFGRVVKWDWTDKYIEIDPSDLINKFDITVDIQSLVEQTRAQRAQELVSLYQSIAPLNNNPISNTPVINPNTIVDNIAKEMWNTTLKAMTNEEREEYAKTELEIMKMVQWANQPAPWVPPTAPQEVPQIDMSSLPWLVSQA